MTIYETKIIELREKLKKYLEEYSSDQKIKLFWEKQIIDDVIFTKESSKEFALDWELLKKIDFLPISFDNVNIKGLDFTDCLNVFINPQTIYDKNLEYTILNGVTFTGPFKDAKIVGANFEGSKNAIIDPQTIHLKNFRETVLTDTLLVNSFDEAFILKTDFTGSTGAIINFETLFDKDICGTNLTDAVIVSPIENVCYDCKTVFSKRL